MSTIQTAARLFTFRKLFSRTLAALEILEIQTNNEPGHIIYELKMKLGRTVTNITKLKETSFMHDVASIVSMLFYFVFGQALSAQCEKGQKGV